MTTPTTPALPRELPALEGPGGSLAHAGPAGSGLLSLGGRRSSAWGVEVRGIDEVRAGGWTLLARFASGLGPASGVVVGPSSVRREMVDAGGSVIETLLIPIDLAGAALQWARPPGSSAGLTLRLEWSVGWRDAHPLTYETNANGVRITAGGTTSTALVVLTPQPSRLEVRPDDLGVRISADVSTESGPLTLLLVGTDDLEAATRALRSLTDLRVQERRAEQATLEAREEGLALASGAGPLGDALEWAKARTRAAVSGAPGSRTLLRGGAACESGPVGTDDRLRPNSPFAPAAEAAWLALGGLAAGNREPAEILLERELANPYELLVAARYVAWTGNGRALLRHRGAALTLCELAEARPLDAAFAAAAAELAVAWETTDPSLARSLRSAAGPPRPAPTHRKLPMAARGDAGGPDDLVRALTDPTPVPYHYLGRPAAQSVEKALRAWALCRAGDLEEGHRLLLEHARAGFLSGAGLWPETVDGARRCSDHAASAALLPAALLFGLLGASADAPVGRLRLAPRTPASWTNVRVAGIRVGDARVRLDYERTSSEHRFRVDQYEGRIPLMLIFEPEVPEGELAEVRVDGSAAALDCGSRRGRSRIRVQLPLDAPRAITLVGRK